MPETTATQNTIYILLLTACISLNVGIQIGKHLSGLAKLGVGKIASLRQWPWMWNKLVQQRTVGSVANQIGHGQSDDAWIRILQNTKWAIQNISEDYM